jgi:hypothetical protein
MVKIASPAVNAGAMTVKRNNPHRINTHHRSEHSKKFSRDQPLAA